MKKSILLISIMTVAQASLAEVGSGYPYVAENNCLQTIQQPKNSGGIAFNKDCSTGFVMPERVGVMTLTPRKSMTLALCPSHAEMIKEIENYSSLVMKYQSKLLNADSKEVDKLVELISTVDKLREASQKRLDGIEAMRVNVTFENRSEGQVKGYTQLNPGTINFVSAPLAQGRISYLVENPDIKNAGAYKSVLSTNIPGNRKTVQDNQGEVDFNGALMGELALTLTGACPFVKVTESGRDKSVFIIDDKINQTITANYTYAVPSISSAGYTASINAERALSLFKDSYVRRGQFTRSEWVDYIVNDKVSQVLDWQMHNFEFADRASAEEVLKTDVATRLTEQFMKALEAYQFVRGEAPKLIEVANGEAPQTATRRECRSSSSFFGLISSSSCYDVPYTVMVPVDGFSNLKAQEAQILNMTFKEEVNLSGIVHRFGTSTFKIKANKSDFDGKL